MRSLAVDNASPLSGFTGYVLAGERPVADVVAVRGRNQQLCSNAVKMLAFLSCLGFEAGAVRKVEKHG